MEETEVQKYQKEYYQKHKEKIKNYNKNWSKENKEHIKKTQPKYLKTYYEKNKNDIIKYGMKYYNEIGSYNRKSYSYNNKITANRFAKQQEEIEKRRAVYLSQWGTEETKGV